MISRRSHRLMEKVGISININTNKGDSKTKTSEPKPAASKRTTRAVEASPARPPGPATAAESPCPSLCSEDAEGWNRFCRDLLDQKEINKTNPSQVLLDAVPSQLLKDEQFNTPVVGHQERKDAKRKLFQDESVTQEINNNNANSTDDPQPAARRKLFRLTADTPCSSPNQGSLGEGLSMLQAYYSSSGSSFSAESDQDDNTDDLVGNLISAGVDLTAGVVVLQGSPSSSSRPVNQNVISITSKPVEISINSSDGSSEISTPAQELTYISNTPFEISTVVNSEFELPSTSELSVGNNYAAEPNSQMSNNSIVVISNEEEIRAVNDMDQHLDTEEIAEVPDHPNIENSDTGENADLVYSKRRQRNPNMWKINTTKQAHAAGIAHKNMKGKDVPARSVKQGCGPTCKKKCHSKLNAEQRQQVVQQFWETHPQDRKWEYILRTVKLTTVRRRSRHYEPEDICQRKYSYAYNFLIKDKEFRVCRTFYLDTLDISATIVRTAFCKMISKSGKVSPDKRGKHQRKRVVSTVILANVVEHIKKFPLVEGHYTRQRSKVQYLDEHLNVRKMHSLYKMEREAAGLQKHTATLRQYRDIFRSEFKLSFFKPKKDQCGTCLSFKNKSIEEKTPEVVAKQDEHIAAKTKARELKNNDLKLAAEDLSVCVCTFDLQKVLYCPKGENSEFFYRSKLSCYNFTIFECTSKKAHLYVWDQTIAHRGPSEITSNLYDFIVGQVNAGVKQFIFYSDNCFAQNKNRFLFSMYSMICLKLKIKITHRYLEKGHTQMECDSTHALIERKLKNIDIFVPAQFYAVMKTAKVSLPKYNVREIGQDMIFDFRPLSKLHDWSRVPTSKIREISFDSNRPGIAAFKKQYNGPENTVIVLRSARGRPINWSTHKLQQQYTARLPVKKALYDDLMWYCQKLHVPSIHHEYFKSLPHDQHLPMQGAGAQGAGPKTRKEMNEDVEDNIDEPEIEESLDSETETVSSNDSSSEEE